MRSSLCGHSLIVSKIKLEEETVNRAEMRNSRYLQRNQNELFTATFPLHIDNDCYSAQRTVPTINEWPHKEDLKTSLQR